MADRQPPRHSTTCVCCDTTGPAAGRGLIRSCYMRHYKSGTLAQFDRERQHQEPKGRVAECVCCGAEGPVKGRGLIYICYQKHRWAGTLAQYPVIAASPHEAIQRAREARQDARVARQEDYAFLRSQGESPQEALARIGLKDAPSTVRRYEQAAGGESW